jgi:hypothetical protein
MFKGAVDRVRKEGRELLYHVTYEDGDEEEFSLYEYTLACQLFESIEVNNDNGDHVDSYINDSNEEGSDYSDTEERKARKMERKAKLAKQNKRKKKITSSPITMSKRARLKAKTAMDTSDIELLGGKDIFPAQTWKSLNPAQQKATLAGRD